MKYTKKLSRLSPPKVRLNPDCFNILLFSFELFDNTVINNGLLLNNLTQICYSTIFKILL